MRPGSAERKQRAAERRLFELHARMSEARAELEIVEAQLAALSEAAEEARVKMLVSETAIAHREWDEARRHEETLRKSAESTRAAIAAMEREQNALFDSLLV
ncbi:MAG: hypothetical protein M0014_07665 [Actinomycetota bacterium]|jgi:hypothetical protein|nr:hypothetical protein [Actinomycetota bacterium]